MAGLLGHQPLVGLFDRGAVVDHRVDFTRDRHTDAVLLGEFHDHTGGLDAFGNLIHAGQDLADGLA